VWALFFARDVFISLASSCAVVLLSPVVNPIARCPQGSHSPSVVGPRPLAFVTPRDGFHCLAEKLTFAFGILQRHRTELVTKVTAVLVVIACFGKFKNSTILKAYACGRWFLSTHAMGPIGGSFVHWHCRDAR